MGKKKKHPEHENLERWLVSYADFITLLFATFTALYALAQADLSKIKDVSEAVREGFQEQSIMNGINSIMKGQSAPNDNPSAIAKQKGAGPGVIGKYDSLTYQPGEVKKVEKTYSKLRQDANQINAKLKQAAKAAGAGNGGTQGKTGENGKGSDGSKGNEKGKGAGGDEPQGSTDLKGTHAPNLGKEESTPAKGIDIAIQERGLRVSFDSRLLFEPGTAILKKESLADLNTIASRLLPYNHTNVIHIEGHTDDQPISSAIYPSNWELSSARASTIVRYLIKTNGFDPKSLVAVGYGDSQPIATNMTPEGRAKNRRVDIIIYSRKVGDEVTPAKQYAKEQALVDTDKTISDSGNLIKTEERDENNRLIEPSKGPIKVIIEESDGSRHDYNPKVTRTISRPSQRKLVGPDINMNIHNKANVHLKPNLSSKKKPTDQPPVPD